MYILAFYIHTYIHTYIRTAVVRKKPCSKHAFGVEIDQSVSHKGISRPLHPSIQSCTSSHIYTSLFAYTHSPLLYTPPPPYTPLFLLPNLTTSPSPARLFHSSVSRFTPSL